MYTNKIVDEEEKTIASEGCTNHLLESDADRW